MKRLAWAVPLSLFWVIIFAAVCLADPWHSTVEVRCGLTSGTVGRGEVVDYGGVVEMGSTWFHITVYTPWGSFPAGEFASHGGRAVHFDGSIHVPTDAPLGRHSVTFYASNGYESGSDSDSFVIKDKGLDVNPVQTSVVAGEDLLVEAVVKGIPDGPVYVDAPWGTVSLTDYDANYSTEVDTFTFRQYIHVPYETLSGSYTLPFRVVVKRYSRVDYWPTRDTFTGSLSVTVLKPPDIRSFAARTGDTFALSGLPLRVFLETPAWRGHHPNVDKLTVVSGWGVEALMKSDDGVHFQGELPILKNTKTGPMDVKVICDLSQPPHYPAKRVEQVLSVFVKNTMPDMLTPAQPSVSQPSFDDWWTPPWYHY